MNEEVCFKLIELYYKNKGLFNNNDMDLYDLFKTYNKMLKINETLEQQIKKQKEAIDKIKKLVESKDNGICVRNGEEKGAYTFVLNFDKAREFIWNLEDILKEVSE